jgi:hypothetical protein
MTSPLRTIVFWAAALLSGLLPGVALAQTPGEFQAAFSGTWQALDASRGNGGICTITLSDSPLAAGLSASQSHCAAPLDTIAAWSIVDGQLSLASAQGSSIGRLGGNQRRMTGDLADGSHLIIERGGGDGTAVRLQSALTAAGCFFLGYSDRCAGADADTSPRLSGGQGSIKVLVDLNARSEARPDAPVLGMVPQGSCLAVNLCTTASDGPWCRAAFAGGEQGWVKKLDIRQDRWPVVTYENQC